MSAERLSITGAVTPALPADSPWRPIGPPQRIERIPAGQPGVASWTWAVPLPPEPRPLHYCIVAFVHSAVAPLSAATGSVDEAVVANAQIAQKNLHILPVLAGGG